MADKVENLPPIVPEVERATRFNIFTFPDSAVAHLVLYDGQRPLVRLAIEPEALMHMGVIGLDLLEGKKQ